MHVHYTTLDMTSAAVISLGVHAVLATAYAARVVSCGTFVSVTAWMYVVLGMAYVLRRSFEFGTQIGHRLKRPDCE